LVLHLQDSLALGGLSDNAGQSSVKALSFNEFGLVCITRKRTKQALERVLCQPCRIAPAPAW